MDSDDIVPLGVRRLKQQGSTKLIILVWLDKETILHGWTYTDHDSGMCKYVVPGFHTCHMAILGKMLPKVFRLKIAADGPTVMERLGAEPQEPGPPLGGGLHLFKR